MHLGGIHKVSNAHGLPRSLLQPRQQTRAPISKPPHSLQEGHETQPQGTHTAIAALSHRPASQVVTPIIITPQRSKRLFIAVSAPLAANAAVPISSSIVTITSNAHSFNVPACIFVYLPHSRRLTYAKLLCHSHRCSVFSIGSHHKSAFVKFKHIL